MLLTLNTWQRLTLLQLVNSTQGDLRTVRKALKALDVLEMTAEEQEAVGLTAHPNGAFSWTEGAHKFELDVTEDVAAFLRERVEAKEDWPASRDVLDLCEQLGIDEGAE